LIHDVNYQPTQALQASATRESASGQVILKVVNVAEDPVTTTIQLDGAGKLLGPATALLLTSGDPNDENTLDEPTKVAPVKREIEVRDARLRETFPGNSVTVIRVGAQ
jgi:alpha-L-arabinofuranosidase